MFAGTFEYRMDRQGRLAIPPQFRRKLGDGLGDGLVMTPEGEALAVYPVSEWRVLEKHVLALPAFSKQSRTLSRVIASRAHECPVDVQGRILVPPSLRRLARLERDVVIVGAMNRFEIWREDSWHAFTQQAERLLDELSSGDLPLLREQK